MAKKVITSERIPIKLWLDDMDENALEQAKNLANLPFAFKHIAIMPDSHLGYGMPIGGVMATEQVIIPNAVGVDIGCGMVAVKTPVEEINREQLIEIMEGVRKFIPTGFKRHKTDNSENGRLMPAGFSECPIVDKEFNNALTQIGTLGGGNHFIEIQKGDDGFVWLMIHSGSRNLGFQVAKHYNDLAIALNEKWRTGVPKAWELAFLPMDSKEGENYLKEMEYCVDFALANRKLMMKRFIEVFMGVMKPKKNIKLNDAINIAHNYASMENHFGSNVMVHRKGATKATESLKGIIPGSMGTPSYIVQGLGNKESFESCAHGAGRRMGRNVARKTLDLEMEQKRMGDIIGKPRGISDLDEAPGAYKPIDVVMANQTDLVKVLVKLQPLAVIKG